MGLMIDGYRSIMPQKPSARIRKLMLKIKVIIWDVKDLRCMGSLKSLLWILKTTITIINYFCNITTLFIALFGRAPTEQNHWIIGKNLWDHWAQPSAQHSCVHHYRLSPGATSTLCSTTSRDSGKTPSLGSLLQCLTTLLVNTFFLIGNI